MFNALPIGPDVRAALAAGLAHEPRLDNRRAFFLIADLDSPRGGVIRVHPQDLLVASHKNLPCTDEDKTRTEDAKRAVADCASALREMLNKLRRRLN